ncbi:hypothetical protein GCM10007423_29430 [Dyadobacter endophyticus]|uniref:Xaa-Pro dipeptidyl-peptidase-like domain-containing protein n=1 Tax=Dyadobacter endophyticus TaxID=1749036 RepID=A0ABQ1YT36_9BACT|nr:CocE/NonD family hydrolase [Dyadobacter endophyticus]GGH36850.1 hypothetical protein GCM10007423_29430 [Dyadobacter endophyticus]
MSLRTIFSDSKPVHVTAFELHVQFCHEKTYSTRIRGDHTDDSCIHFFVDKSVLSKKTVNLRPQESKPPFPYNQEDITFENPKAGIKLAGTLTLPAREGNFPAVILISGGGPSDSDVESIGHKPFLVIVDHLTRNGIAVLRFDDRGVKQSEGDYQSAISADFADDTENAVRYLKTRKEINSDQIGLAGHSE